MNTEKRILVVDDEPDIVRLIKFTLETKGFHIITARSGKEALEKAKEIKPSLVLLDVMMPEMNGYEVCKILKDSPETVDIPVVMLSAKSQKAEIERGLSAGAKDYISKPFSPKELNEKISKFLAVSKQEGEVNGRQKENSCS